MLRKVLEKCKQTKMNNPRSFSELGLRNSTARGWYFFQSYLQNICAGWYYLGVQNLKEYIKIFWGKNESWCSFSSVCTIIIFESMLIHSVHNSIDLFLNGNTRSNLLIKCMEHDFFFIITKSIYDTSKHTKRQNFTYEMMYLEE